MSLRPYLGVNVNPTSIDEMLHRGLLEEGETLLALFDGFLLDEQGKRVGGLALSDFLALTDQRVIMWARGFFNDTVDGVPWSDIDVAEFDTWDPFHGRVRLAIRLPAVAPRTRRINVKGNGDTVGGKDERVFVNTLDYMPSDDVAMLADMVGWVGDQLANGVTGEALAAAFGEAFPAVDRKPMPPMFQQLQSRPEPEPELPPEPEKKGWWPFGGERKPTPSVNADSSQSLIAAYERERGGVPASSGTGTPIPIMRSNGSSPLMPEQPGMYDVSRALRLMLDVPRRLKGTVKRASDVVTGTNELLTSVKDPQTRRTAINGLRRVVQQHEEDQGPLAAVGPVVRAVLTFSEPTPDELPQNETPAAKRIQVRAAVRPRSTPVEVENTTPEPAVPSEPHIQASNGARRQINIRREPPPPQTVPLVNEAEDEPELPSTPTVVRASATVRRQIDLRRDEAPTQPVPIANDTAFAPEPEDAPSKPTVVRASATVRRQVPIEREAVHANGNGNGNGHHNGNGNGHHNGLHHVESPAPEAPAEKRSLPVRRIVVSRDEKE
ncbi:MAG: hypothetical protein MUD01_22910 [Chloroflexaceae bacterium]|jgi:hypothetical protein|nr:hypothetical protein [Chloroflexaceae bacterium]